MSNLYRMHHDWNFGFMSNTEEWKKYRRVFMSKFGPGNVHIYDPVQENASHELLQRLLEEPEEFLDHIRLCVIISLSFRNAVLIDVQTRWPAHYNGCLRDSYHFSRR